MSTPLDHRPIAYYVLIRQDTPGGRWYWKVLQGGVCRHDGDAATWAEANRKVGDVMKRFLIGEYKEETELERLREENRQLRAELDNLKILIPTGEEEEHDSTE
jgi:hypothetical protein